MFPGRRKALSPKGALLALMSWGQLALARRAMHEIVPAEFRAEID
jgi:hypothetical protein